MKMNDMNANVSVSNVMYILGVLNFKMFKIVYKL